MEKWIFRAFLLFYGEKVLYNQVKVPKIHIRCVLGWNHQARKAVDETDRRKPEKSAHREYENNDVLWYYSERQNIL